ncbi:MAG: MerR family transcriptional regulator, partial [Candidatus Thermofonsia bacterium]
MYNLKAVVTKTGMKPDTIRAWERRYGLPLPKRTKGRHRLYSQRDLETIKWLQARLAEGMSISQAVKLWRSLEADDHDPLHIYESKATQETAVSVHGDQ